MMKIDSEASKVFAPQRTVSVTSGSIFLYCLWRERRKNRILDDGGLELLFVEAYDVSLYSNRWREPDNEKEITTTDGQAFRAICSERVNELESGIIPLLAKGWLRH